MSTVSSEVLNVNKEEKIAYQVGDERGAPSAQSMLGT